MQEDAVIIEQLLRKRAKFELGPLTLHIPKGYVTAIVGPNGSGKSSLFRMMLNLMKPDSGRIELLGWRIGDEDDSLLRQRIGYLPDEPIEPVSRLRAEQKAAFTQEWFPVWDANRFRELLRRFEVDLSYRLSKMSKGMRRKFELALAMGHNPELLLLDEPSSGLDPIAWKTMIDVLHRYMERGDRTIVLATHIIDEVRRLADYVVFLVHGRVLGIYEKDALLESWYRLYAEADEEADIDWRGLPGLHQAERTGGGAFSVTTGSVAEAEEWCRAKGIRIAGRQKLELDDIMTLLVERERIRMHS